MAYRRYLACQARIVSGDSPLARAGSPQIDICIAVLTGVVHIVDWVLTFLYIRAIISIQFNRYKNIGKVMQHDKLPTRYQYG